MRLHWSYFLFFTLYFSAIAIEAWFSKRNNSKYYEWKDSIFNLSLGIAVSGTRVVFDFIRFPFWIYLSKYSLFDIQESIYMWVGLFLGLEFLFYWFHRLSHYNRFLWAVHVNHHSSTKLNMLTSARLPLFSMVLQTVFFTPLVLIGFNPILIFVMTQIGFIFVAFQHLRIGKIPYLGYILNIPTYHQVHHASNPEYLNHNFGMVLIIFDRMFGTFLQPKEHIKIQYGITKNIHTYNPIKVIFHEWIDIFHEYRHKARKRKG